MHIREVTTNDFDIFKRLQAQIHSFHAAERPDIYTAHHLEVNTFNSLIEDQNRKIFFAVDDVGGEVVGYTMLKIVEDADAAKKNMVTRKVVTVSEICVEEEQRGRGVGKFLFNEAVSFARSIGADGFNLGVWEFNEVAIKFYEKMGMKTQTRKMELEL